MDQRLRIFLFCLLTVAIGTVGYHLTRELREPVASRESIGLEWLRHEYQIPDDRFAQIAAMHRAYFARCDAMCEEMMRAHRFSLNPARRASTDAQAARQREKAICETCVDTMVGHLRAVASLLPAEQQQRFLNDIMPDVLSAPELQELSSTRPAAATSATP